jgi:hypothetical protein
MLPRQGKCIDWGALVLCSESSNGVMLSHPAVLLRSCGLLYEYHRVSRESLGFHPGLPFYKLKSKLKAIRLEIVHTTDSSTQLQTIISFSCLITVQSDSHR